MTEILSSLVSVLNASTAFSVTGTDAADAELDSSLNVLNPNVLDQGAVDVAYIFYPPANISLLAGPTAASLLQAQEQSE